ncbi:hypothetical protein EVAR_80938_1 [Eumeta japonica]|uniref:Uncharacterized protein n=1 Tax=Eumeta variegata TaxID=151549 RepID=A0A4C1V0Y0_EUMVA|nr:hypothetical protein EVAR_80938_1 [Eumeta japonica]
MAYDGRALKEMTELGVVTNIKWTVSGIGIENRTGSRIESGAAPSEVGTRAKSALAVGIENRTGPEPGSKAMTRWPADTAASGYEAMTCAMQRSAARNFRGRTIVLFKTVFMFRTNVGRHCTFRPLSRQISIANYYVSNNAITTLKVTMGRARLHVLITQL